MKIPKFEYFLQTLTEEKVLEIVNRVNEEPVNVTIKLSTLSESLSDFTEQLLLKNFDIAIVLLEEYHNWLSEQLDKE